MENTNTHVYVKNEWVRSKVKSTLSVIIDRRLQERNRVIAQKLAKLNKPLNWFQKLFKKQQVFTEKDAANMLEAEYASANWKIEAALYRSHYLYQDLETLCFKLEKATKISDGGIYLSIEDMDRLI